MPASSGRKLGIGLGVVLSVSPAAASETLGVRNAHGLAYHAGLERTILFGGADERSVRGDTWSWDGARWELFSTGGPSARTFPAVAYDEKRGELVLFGGNSVLFGEAPDPRTFLGDTWILSAEGWEPLEAPGPSPRAEAVMAWDERRERLVLFGGHRLDENRQRVRLGDTWEWDGTTWREVARSGPSPRNGASVSFSPRHEGVVLFGGNGPSAETWLWNGAAWVLLPLPETPGRFNAGLSRDPSSSDLVRFGGWNGKERLGDTWILGAIWRQVDVSGPSPRNHAPLALDRRRGRVVVFGGHDGDNVFGDTWEWDGARWIEAAPAPSKARIDNGH